MKKEKFAELFRAGLEEAAKVAEANNNTTVPRNFECEFYGCGFDGDILSVDEALEFLYLGENEFYVVIDLAILKATSTTTTVFVRVSGHYPVQLFEETWNEPNGFGPFKQIISLQFQQE